MIGLLLAVVIFNIIAFKINKRLTLAQIVQIWTFTIAFQLLFDLIIEFKFRSYWYFGEGIDWKGLIPRTVLIPPVNIIFLNLYPWGKSVILKGVYVISFVAMILLYELAALLPEPWGYFHYGWWKIWYSALIDPIILYILLGFYKWILWLEKKDRHKALPN